MPLFSYYFLDTLFFVQHPSAKIGEHCRIGPNVVIGANAVIQDGRQHFSFNRTYRVVFSGGFRIFERVVADLTEQ